MQPLLVALSIAAMFFGGVVLYVAVTRIVRLLRDSEVARIPVAAEATVAFGAPGTYILHVDRPRLSMAMLAAKFALRNDVTGTEVRSSPVIMRTTSGGFSTARVSVRSFDVERAGRYLLVVTGVDPGSDLSQIHLIFTRPYAAALLLLILATVFGGACLVGGLVFTALQLTGKV